MKKAAGIILLLIAAATLLGQNRSGFVGTPGVFRSFPNGVQPGVQRFTGSVVNPGSPSRNSPQIGIPRVPLQPPNFSSNRSFRTVPNRVFPGTFGFKGFDRFGKFDGFGRGFGKGFNDFGFGNGSVFAYPVFVPGNGDYVGGDYPPPAPAAPPESNIFVIYPPPAAPVIINNGEARRNEQASRIYEVPEREVVVEQPQERATYLLAFRDKSVYAALGYWVEGETLHYITANNTHNSVSLSLVDRELTAKLNQGSGLEVKLPPVRN